MRFVYNDKLYMMMRAYIYAFNHSKDELSLKISAKTVENNEESAKEKEKVNFD